MVLEIEEIKLSSCAGGDELSSCTGGDVDMEGESARSVSLLQQNTIITVETCCIIHGKVCCNSFMQHFLQHEHTVATNCCNTSTPLQRFVATQAALLLQQHACCNASPSVSIV